MTVGYFCAIGIAVIFMLYLDGAIGVMMLAFLLLMPVLSLVMTLLVRKTLSVRLILPDTAAKQKELSAVIQLDKTTPLPLPFLRMALSADAHFEPLNPEAEPLPELANVMNSAGAYRKYRKQRKTRLLPDVLPLCLSMGTAKRAQYAVRLQARYCGAGQITLTDIQLSDYLAMFRFRLKITCTESVLITPEIPELKANSTLFRSVSTAVAAADEETETTPNHSASAMPGYDHRDYIPGDSLKRINWKLSSKRHHLMVRQDEPVALARLSVVLDFRRDKRQIPLTDRLSAEEQLIETALGFLMLCAKYGYPCKLCYADLGGTWNSLAIDDGGQLAVEAITLLRGGFRAEDALGGLPLLPPELTQDTGAVLLYFTTHGSAETAAMLEQYPTLLYLVVPEVYAENCAVPKNGSLWYTTADHSLEHAGGEL